MPGAALTVLAAAAKSKSTGWLLRSENLGTIIFGSISGCAVCICTCANLKHRLFGKTYTQTDLAEGKHEVGKTARIQYYKNGKLVGIGKVTFNGKTMKMAFLPERFNEVSLKYMKVSQDGTMILLQDRRRSTNRVTFEFAEAAEAKAWTSVLKKAAKEVTAAQYAKENHENYAELWKQVDYGVSQKEAESAYMPSMMACCLTRAPQNI